MPLAIFFLGFLVIGLLLTYAHNRMIEEVDPFLPPGDRFGNLRRVWHFGVNWELFRQHRLHCPASSWRSRYLVILTGGVLWVLLSQFVHLH